MKDKPKCQYQSPDGHKCQEIDMGSGLCFWHDPNFDKSGLELSQKLERYAKRGGLLQGLELKRANLEGINLVKHNDHQGYDLSYSNFYRANLRGAHLFNNKIENASLMKANLQDANLHCCKLSNSNLLGIKLSNTRIDNIELHGKLQQENEAALAMKEKRKDDAADFFLQSEETYRTLRKGAEQQGLFEMAGNYTYKELRMRHFQYPKHSQKRFMSAAVDLLCGYGEKPANVIRFSLAMIVVCAFLYFIFGISYQDEVLSVNFSKPLSDNISALLNSIYFSVVTFTTLGYGDITPIGFSRLIATFEAFTGSFSLALFVVVFVKRMTR